MLPSQAQHPVQAFVVITDPNDDDQEQSTEEFRQAVESAEGDIVKVLAEDSVSYHTHTFPLTSYPSVLQRWFGFDVAFPVRDGSHRTTYTCEYSAVYPNEPKFSRLYFQLYWSSTEMDSKTVRIIDQEAVKVCPTHE
jgi:hypothetical protein